MDPRGQEFVGVVHFCRPPDLFSFGLRKLYMFGDISLMAARGEDLTRTPTMNLRLNGETFHSLSVRTRAIDTT